MLASTPRGAGLAAALLATILGAGCASSAAPVNTAPALPVLPLDTKVSWILRLEQQRVLRDADVPPSAEPAAPSAPAAARAGAAAEAAASKLRPAQAPDLVALLQDVDPGVRRRSALAIGRVGRPEGVPPLLDALGDEDEDVRAAAAFALGLIGSDAAVVPLQAALADPSYTLKARAAEALGLIGKTESAAAVADAAASCAAQLAPIPPDDESWPKTDAVEFCRQAVFALVRLKDYHHLARVVLDSSGQPVSSWWPVAFALQRIDDAQAVPALLKLAEVQGVYTPAFALRGLAAAHERRAVPVAQRLATSANADVRLRVAAVRALGDLGSPAVADALMGIVRSKDAPRNLVLEAVAALGAAGDPRGFDLLLDLFTDPWPSLRAAALSSAARINPDAFLLVASGLPPDADWSVRATLATILADLPAEQVRAGLADLTTDKDPRVQAAALRSLAKVGAPDLADRLFAALDTDDFVVRATAAELIGAAKPAGGIERLTAAYTRGVSDSAYSARAAALAALATYGTDEARTAVRRGLDDKAWPVRLRAAELLRGLGDESAEPATPAPLRQPAEYFQSPGLLHPSFSPHAFLQTKQGTIELELNLVDAPVTSQSFIDLARLGFFNGLKIHRVVPNFVVQAGDPRGDSEGGPGFTLMDELGTQPFLRGTVGMALDWRDTGGSQFFVTLSPQPHLDAKYTVFAKVVRGDEVLDQLGQWDVIERVQIWDGVELK